MLEVWQPVPGKIFVEIALCAFREREASGHPFSLRKGMEAGSHTFGSSTCCAWRVGLAAPSCGHCCCAQLLNHLPSQSWIQLSNLRLNQSPLTERDPSETEATQGGSHYISLSLSWPPGCILGTLCRALEGTDLATEATAGSQGCRTVTPRLWTSPSHPQRLCPHRGWQVEEGETAET